MTKESYNFGVDTKAQLYTETSGMTEKRFTINNDMNFNNKVETYELNCIRDNDNETFYFIADSIENVQLFVKRLNELHEENQQIKDLIHTMLRQIEVENISSDSAIYSARIIFSRNEFNLIRELWKRSI